MRPRPVRPAQPLVIAHRGASGYRPENTLSALQLAVDQRADMIEIDLHLSRDDAIVVRHETDLSSLGLKREIRAADLAQIQSLDAGDGEKIPTLDEVLDRFGSEIAFNLEIKTGSDGAYPGLEAAALRAVDGRGLLASTLFSAFARPVFASEVGRPGFGAPIRGRARARPGGWRRGSQSLVRARQNALDRCRARRGVRRVSVYGRRAGGTAQVPRSRGRRALYQLPRSTSRTGGRFAPAIPAFV